MIWDRIKAKINETFKPEVRHETDNGFIHRERIEEQVEGYNPITKRLPDKTKVFDTTEKLNKIKKDVKKDNTVLVYNPLSQRTFFRNPETGSFVGGKVEIGDEKTSDKEQVLSVVSTAIQSIKYDPKKQRAYVVFKDGDGKEYTYKVTPEEFDDFLNASSKGRHVAKEWNHNKHFRA